MKSNQFKHSILILAMLSSVGPGLKLHAAKATGFVRVEQIEGRWWFIDGAGEKFISMGVNHIEPHLWLAPYNKQNTLERYGPDMVDASGRFNTDGMAARQWINRQVEICRDLHFNTFGKHIHPSIDATLYDDQIYYIASLGTAPSGLSGIQPGEGPLPDIFSSDFKVHLHKRVEEVVNRHKNELNLLGYIYTDVPNWVIPKNAREKEGGDIMIYPWINSILKLGVESPGKNTWISHLQARYAEPQEVAAAWGIATSPLYGISWEKLVASTLWFSPVDKEAAQKDMVSFMGLIAEEWYKSHHDAIKNIDENHLILGDKNLVEAFEEFLIPSLKQYVDVVVTQSHRRWADDEKTNDWIYEQIGKPILNGDGSFAYVHPRQAKLKVKGWWTKAGDVNEVAALYQETLAPRYLSISYSHLS